MGPNTWLTIFLLVISSMGLAGCQSRSLLNTTTMKTAAPLTTVPAALAANEQPAGKDLPVSQESIPAGEQPASPDQGAYPYPAPNLRKDIAGPGAPGVVDNQSLVTARLVAQSSDETDPAYVRLHVEIQSSKKIFGPADFTAKFVNKEVDLYALAADLPSLSPGDRFEAKVWYRPNEPVKQYNASEIKKLS